MHVVSACLGKCTGDISCHRPQLHIPAKCPTMRATVLAQTFEDLQLLRRYLDSQKNQTPFNTQQLCPAASILSATVGSSSFMHRHVCLRWFPALVPACVYLPTTACLCSNSHSLQLGEDAVRLLHHCWRHSLHACPRSSAKQAIDGWSR